MNPPKQAPALKQIYEAQQELVRQNESEIADLKHRLEQATKRQKGLVAQLAVSKENYEEAASKSVAGTNFTTGAGNLEETIRSMVKTVAKFEEHIKKLNEKIGKSEEATEKFTFTKKLVHIKVHTSQSSKLSCMTVDMTKDLQKRLNLSIRSYIRDKMYSNYKFIRNDVWANRITVLALEEGYVSVPFGWTKLEFTEHMKPHIKRCYSDIRHNSQSLARKHFMEDNPRGNVPDKFPGSLGLTVNGEGKIGLNPDYRKAIGSEEFNYFIDRTLAALNPTRSRFKERKHKELISKIYSVADEAFGLLIIYNEHHVWLDQEKLKMQGDKGHKIKKRKRFCNSSSGSKEGWSAEGVRLFYDLCREIKKRREETITMEEEIKQAFVVELGELNTSKATPGERVRNVIAYAKVWDPDNLRGRMREAERKELADQSNEDIAYAKVWDPDNLRGRMREAERNELADQSNEEKMEIIGEV